jgi:hypothetical protein
MVVDYFWGGKAFEDESLMALGFFGFVYALDGIRRAH